MKLKHHILILMTMCGLLSSCDNTLNVNAEWKEIAVVYGLINPTDGINYIKIGKAYLNPDGDALSIAQISDSLYFDSLDVKMVEYRNGTETRIFQLDLVNGNDIGIEKDPGLFAKNVNYLYRLTAQLNESNITTVYNYKLVIVNRESGKVITANCDMLGRAELLSPVKFLNPILNIPNEPNRSLLLKYREGKLAKVYDGSLRFYFEEMDASDTNIRHIDSVDWLLFKDKETASLTGYSEKNAIISGTLFYDNLLVKLDSTKQVYRRPLSFSIFIYGGGEDLYTYYEVNKPSIGIVQKKPEFTNISPGIGVFSSRYINRFTGIKPEETTLNYLVQSDKMKALRFIY